MFNHDLGPDQMKDAETSLGIEKFVEMPPVLKQTWQQIPADVENIEEIVMPMGEWLRNATKKGDVVLIQGDFGATYLLVKCALGLGLLPVYATTRRLAEEIRQEDGTMKVIHVFKHVRFRRYV